MRQQKTKAVSIEQKGLENGKEKVACCKVSSPTNINMV